MDTQVKLNQMKWKISNSVWKKSFNENVDSICTIFKIKVIEGWEVEEVWGDFQSLIFESLDEMSGDKEEEKLEDDNFNILILKHTIKETMEVGTKELGSEDEALKVLGDKMIDMFCEMMEWREKEVFWRKWIRKAMIQYRLFMYKFFN